MFKYGSTLPAESVPTVTRDGKTVATVHGSTRSGTSAARPELASTRYGF